MAREDIVRRGFELRAGVPDFDSIHYTPFVSETFAPDRPQTPDGNQQASNNPGPSENLKATGAGDLTVEPTSESHPVERIHQHGWYDLSAPAVGVSLLELRDRDTGVDPALSHYVGSLWFGAYRDVETDPSEYKAFGAVCTSTEITAAANEYLKVKSSWLYTRDTYSRIPTRQAVDADFTGQMAIVGHRPYGDTSASADYYKFKVADATPGEETVVWGKGAGAYSATEFPLVDNMDVRDGLDAVVGSVSEPYRVRVTLGGTFTVGDEWRIYPDQPKPVPAFSTRPKLNSNSLDISFVLSGGATIDRVIPAFTITHGTPKEGVPGVGSKYFQKIREANNARRSLQISFSTEYISRELTLARLQQVRIAANVKFWGGPIGSTGLSDFWEFDIPAMKLAEAGATSTTSGNIDESVVLTAEPENPGDPLFTEYIQNTIASYAP